MNPNALTEDQLAAVIGKTAEDVRSYLRAGMSANPDGTFNLTACIAWKLNDDKKKDN